MAFPTVQETFTQSINTATTPHSIDMPATVNADELLIIIHFVNETGATSIPTPTGWTLGFGFNDSNSLYYAFWRQADGTEGGTQVDLDTPSEGGSTNGYRISGWNSVEFSSSLNKEFNTDEIQPPSLTASWGAKDNLWIANGVHLDTPSLISSIPVEYSNPIDAAFDTGGTRDAGMTGSCRRENNTDTEDPGIITLDTVGSHTLATTIVVEPGSKGAGGTNFDGSVSIGHTLGLSPSASAAVTGGVTNAQTMGMSDQGGATTLASLEQAISLALQTSGAISFEGNITINVSYGQGSSATASTSAELSGAENVTLFHAYTMSTSAVSSASGATTIGLTLDQSASGGASAKGDSELDIGFDQSASGVKGSTTFTASVSLGAITHQTSITGTASTVADATQAIQYALDSIAAAAVSSGVTIDHINDISATGNVITVDVTLSDGRTLSVSQQNRTLSIDTENRTLTIKP